MKLIPLWKAGEKPDKDTLKAEFKAADRAGEARMGGLHFFYRYFINIKYVPYEKICKAYLRVESGESGEFLLKEFYLMVLMRDESTAKLRFEREENARAVLAYLEAKYPHIGIGYKRP